MSQESGTPQRNRFNPSELERAVDKQIREAIERGDFDNLRGHGKPLDLRRDPNVPAEWEMAFNLLKNAGFAPDWIETRKEIDREREQLFAPLNRFAANPPRQLGERQRQAARLVAQFRQGAAKVNRLIDLHNLKAPSDQVHLRRIRVEFEVDKFLKSAGVADL